MQKNYKTNKINSKNIFFSFPPPPVPNIYLNSMIKGNRGWFREPELMRMTKWDEWFHTPQYQFIYYRPIIGHPQSIPAQHRPFLSYFWPIIGHALLSPAYRTQTHRNHNSKFRLHHSFDSKNQPLNPRSSKDIEGGTQEWGWSSSKYLAPFPLFS